MVSDRGAHVMMHGCIIFNNIRYVPKYALWLIFHSALTKLIMTLLKKNWHVPQMNLIKSSSSLGNRYKGTLFPTEEGTLWAE